MTTVLVDSCCPCHLWNCSCSFCHQSCNTVSFATPDAADLFHCFYSSAWLWLGSDISSAIVQLAALLLLWPRLCPLFGFCYQCCIFVLPDQFILVKWTWKEHLGKPFIGFTIVTPVEGAQRLSPSCLYSWRRYICTNHSKPFNANEVCV